MLTIELALKRQTLKIFLEVDRNDTYVNFLVTAQLLSLEFTSSSVLDLSEITNLYIECLTVGISE